MRKFILLTVITFLLWHGVAFGYEVQGKVYNETTDSPVVHHPVALQQFKGQQGKVIAVDSTNQDGLFRFEELETTGRYGLSVMYQTVKYDDIQWEGPPAADDLMQVTVWDTTQTDTAVKISMQHAVLTEGEGRLFVRQIMRVENSGNKTFKGTVPVAENTYKTLEFMLPKNATNIRPGKGFMQCCVGTMGKTFYDTMELFPGSRDVVLYYELPVNSKQFVFRERPTYPVDSYVALIKRQKAKVSSDMLSVLETAADESMVQLAANKVKEGTVIPIRFENFLQPPRDYGRYFLGLFAVLIIGGIIVARKGKHTQEEKEEQAMPRDPVCRMPVPEDDMTYTTVYQGVTYYFCCEHCQEAFRETPEEYVGSSDSEKDTQ